MGEERAVQRAAQVRVSIWTLALAAFSLAAFSMVACSPAPDIASREGAAPAGQAPADSPVAGPAVPGTTPIGDLPPETISIEGMPEVLPVRRVESPPSFPLQFNTVAPQDMRVEYVSSGEGDAVRFEAEFGGVHNPAALLSMLVLPPGTTSAEARQWLVDITGGEPRDPPPGGFPDWMVEAFTLRGARSGFAALGEREGRWFYFHAAYPPEFGDGMGPRVDLILRRWRWGDGSLLTPTR